jgi:hypothetical protein
MLRRLLFVLGLALSAGQQQCPDGLFAIETSCVSSCPPGYLTERNLCIRCPLSFDERCVDTCPPDTTKMSDQCVPGCGPDKFSIVGSTVCVDACPTGTYAAGSQCIPGCPPDSFIVATTGECVQRCPESTILSGTMCIPDCPLGMIPMNSKCVSAADMCASLVRGSQMIGSMCRCPPTMWMERITEGPTIGACVPAVDSSALVNCPSFVANSRFDMEIMSCTCSGSILQNPTDKQYPFACGSTSDVSIIRCDETARFDLLEGECKPVGGAAFPEKPTTRSSISPFPSLQTTAKPTVSPVVSRTPQRTDVIWKPDISRPPLPSLRPLFTPLRASPMPTPWRPVKPMEPTIERPPYIQSTLRFLAANESAIRKSEKLQEIQASLACSLRMPVENIRIMNITVLQADGSRKVIIPEFTPLSGNGSVHCFTLMERSSSRLLRSRSLQQVGSVDIDYVIVDPTVDILSLTPAEFSAVVGSSSVVAAVAASVGSTGVSVSSESTAQSTTPASSSGSTIQVGAVAGGVVGGIVIAAIGATIYRIATRKKRIVRTAPVAEVHRSNPLQTSSARMVFTPATTRTGV